MVTADREQEVSFIGLGGESGAHVPQLSCSGRGEGLMSECPPPQEQELGPFHTVVRRGVRAAPCPHGAHVRAGRLRAGQAGILAQDLGPFW